MGALAGFNEAASQDETFLIRTLALKKKNPGFYSGKKCHMHLNVFYFPNIKQLKTELPFPFTSKVRLFCGTHGLFKDPVFLSDYFLLMVEFCNHFWVGHRWQQPEGIPGGFGVKKTLRGLLCRSDVGQWQPQGSDSFLACDWLPNLWLPLWGPSAPPRRK